MRKVSLLIGSAILALALPAYADATGAPPPTTAAAEQPVAETAPAHPRFQVGLSYVPMVLGTITAKGAGTVSKGDGAFAYGVGLNFSVNVFRGLTVGIAPQAIYTGKVKAADGGGYTTYGTDTQYDMLLRLAYSYWIPEVATFYVEVLPGYSIVYPSTQDTSKGLVMVYGIGAELDLSKRVYANVGIGYQAGYQTESSAAYYRNSYVRGTVGIGMRF